MMAIRPASTLAIQPAAPQSSFYYSRGKGRPRMATNPTPFRPTRLGLNVTKPDFAAEAHNANAYLLNTLVGPRDPYRKLYLFVDKISTGWTVGGSFAQTNMSKTWYPRNLTQDMVTITGHVANQFEFDRIARFVAHAINSALGVGGNASMFVQDDWFNYVTFRSFKPQAGNIFNHSVNIDWGVVPVNFSAGHERFQFAPAFTLACKVIDDRTDKHRKSLYTTLTESGNELTAIFGDYTVASPHTAGTTKDPTPAKKRKRSSLGSSPSGDGAWLTVPKFPNA